jgi:hypothetical protein
MKLYWDIQNHSFLESNLDSQEIQSLAWILRDQVAVTLYIMAPTVGSQGFTIQEAPLGYSVRFAVKASGSFSGAALVYAGTWTLAGTGTGSSYSAAVDLNTVALIALLEAETQTEDYLDLVGEFALEDASGNHRDSTQVTVRISKDVIRSTDVTPTAIQPLCEEFTHSGSKCLRIRNSDGVTLAVLTPPGVTYP